jgi:hypothetical protein
MSSKNEGGDDKMSMREVQSLFRRFLMQDVVESE